MHHDVAQVASMPSYLASSSPGKHDGCGLRAVARRVQVSGISDVICQGQQWEVRSICKHESEFVLQLGTCLSPLYMYILDRYTLEAVLWHSAAYLVE